MVEASSIPISRCQASLILNGSLARCGIQLRAALAEPMADNHDCPEIYPASATPPWIVRIEIAAERPLLFSMQHKLKAGRTVALRVIRSKSNRPDMILSLLCLASLKSTEDLPLIESLLDNETILWPQRGDVVKEQVSGDPPGVNTNYNVRTRDVALIVAACLHDIRPDDIGCRARRSSVTFFIPDSLGFRTEHARSRALAAYRCLADR